MTSGHASSGERTQTGRGALARQGSLLFAGYGAAQVLSFVRNALIGHALSKGEFGIAATITMILQVFDTLSDLGADRLIVQADDGATARFLAASHAVLALRGLALCLLMVLLAPALASFFAVSHAAPAFQLAALVPLIKGFQHLDWRRAQRRLDNRPHVTIEVVPQALALTAAMPIVAMSPGYASVVWIGVLQAAASVAVSHAVAHAPYRIAIEPAILKRQIAFGWPILASALPLLAVYQGDRIIIARNLGMEELASFTVAFLATMVPGLIGSKVGFALLLPAFSQARRAGSLAAPFAMAAEATSVFAAAYLCAFIIGGALALPLLFGSKYAGLGPLVSLLAFMWSLRILQAVPGIALMAAGETRPFLTAGVVRALALPFVLWAAMHGSALEALAGIGAAFELASLVYVAARLRRLEHGIAGAFLMRATFLAPSAALGAAVSAASLQWGLWTSLMAAAAAGGIVAAAGVVIMPQLRALARSSMRIAAESRRSGFGGVA